MPRYLIVDWFVQAPVYLPRFQNHLSLLQVVCFNAFPEWCFCFMTANCHCKYSTNAKCIRGMYLKDYSALARTTLNLGHRIDTLFLQMIEGYCFENPVLGTPQQSLSSCKHISLRTISQQIGSFCFFIQEGPAR
jgi:hypothetical protein